MSSFVRACELIVEEWKHPQTVSSELADTLKSLTEQERSLAEMLREALKGTNDRGSKTCRGDRHPP